MVERVVLGDLHQPRAGIARHAFGRPLFERRDQRVVREILGQADVADHADESGDQARRFDAPDRVDGALDVGACACACAGAAVRHNLPSCHESESSVGGAHPL